MSVNLSLAKPGDWFLTYGGHLMEFKYKRDPHPCQTWFPFVLYNPALKCTVSYTPYGFYRGDIPDKKDLQCKVRLKPGTVLHDQFTHNLEITSCPQQPNT